jgi:SAM-dependent methyltransferase
VRTVRARIQDADLAAESFDLVFARWVLSFPADPASLVRRISSSLKIGGVFAVEDYNHEGVSLFPESAGFRAVVRATRELYAQAGGDAWVAARLPSIFRGAGLEAISFVPNVLCGGPGSGPFRWAGLFFPHFSEAMEQKGLLTSEERQRFLTEWSERETNPDAMFFSPIVVDAAGRKRT